MGHQQNHGENGKTMVNGGGTDPNRHSATLDLNFEQIEVELSIDTLQKSFELFKAHHRAPMMVAGFK